MQISWPRATTSVVTVILYCLTLNRSPSSPGFSWDAVFSPVWVSFGHVLVLLGDARYIQHWWSNLLLIVCFTGNTDGSWGSAAAFSKRNVGVLSGCWWTYKTTLLNCSCLLFVLLCHYFSRLNCKWVTGDEAFATDADLSGPAVYHCSLSVNGSEPLWRSKDTHKLGFPSDVPLSGTVALDFFLFSQHLFSP